MPDELSGRAGPNRQLSPTLEANDDFAAVQAWLSTLPLNENTQRSYLIARKAPSFPEGQPGRAEGGDE